MAIEHRIQDTSLLLEYRPERSAAMAGLGCSFFLLVFTGIGVVEVVRTGQWDSLLGLPCTLLFALAFAVLGLTRGHSIVDAQRRMVINERRFLGMVIRRDVLPFGVPISVVVDVLGRDRRPFYLVSVLGAARQAEVVSAYEEPEGLAVGQAIADFLGVPLEQRAALPVDDESTDGVTPDPEA